MLVFSLNDSNACVSVLSNPNRNIYHLSGAVVESSPRMRGSRLNNRVKILNRVKIITNKLSKSNVELCNTNFEQKDESVML